MAKGNLQKMATALKNGMAYYDLRIGEEKIPLAGKIGKKIELSFEGIIHCVACGEMTKKSYNQGYCGRCLKTLAQCDLCIVKPELCHYDDGTCREPDWGKKHCMIPHYVYLANASGVKVGITRHTQIPTRWIDQGAIQALPVFKVGSRYQSGMFEKLISEMVSDKTNWRQMLKGEVQEEDLEGRRDEIFETLGDALEELEDRYGDEVEFLEDEEVTTIEYPVEQYPEKIKSLGLDKQDKIEGTLMGIKGQYLILDTGVFNVRKHGGYLVSFK